ncbi:MAG: TolC family protein, partial [Gemmatimonadota bacterium]
APLTPLPEVDSALALAAASRLDLAMARAAVAIAEGRRTAERRAVLPDVGLVGGYKGTAGFETSLFGVTLTAPLLNTNAGNRERTAGEWLRAEAERRATELRVTTEVHAALEAARVIDAGTRDFDARFVARADLVAGAAQAAYQEGAASLVELVDAFRAAAEARTAQVRGTLDRALARLDLRRAIGAPALETP